MGEDILPQPLPRLLGQGRIKELCRSNDVIALQVSGDLNAERGRHRLPLLTEAEKKRRDHPDREAGVAELERVVGAAAAHVPRRFEDGELVSVEDERALFPAHFQVDLGIARGLDYYTGTVYETRLDAAPKIGSICSGGRYENLVGNFVDRKFPGVGISIGLTRLMARLFESGLVKAGGTAVAPVLVTVQDPSCLDRYKEIAARLRLAGIRTELFLEAKRLDKQIQYADRKGFPLVVVANREELERDTVVLKNMRARQEQRVGIAQLPPLVRSMTPPEFD